MVFRYCAYDAAVRFVELPGARTCRTVRCNATAYGDNDFCPRCREELDAVHLSAGAVFPAFRISPLSIFGKLAKR